MSKITQVLSKLKKIRKSRVIDKMSKSLMSRNLFDIINSGRLQTFEQTFLDKKILREMQVLTKRLINLNVLNTHKYPKVYRGLHDINNSIGKKLLTGGFYSYKSKFLHTFWTRDRSLALLWASARNADKNVGLILEKTCKPEDIILEFSVAFVLWFQEYAKKNFNDNSIAIDIGETMMYTDNKNLSLKKEGGVAGLLLNRNNDLLNMMYDWQESHSNDFKIYEIGENKEIVCKNGFYN